MAVDITALYCCLDEFCKVFADWEAHRLLRRSKHASAPASCRAPRCCLSWCCFTSRPTRTSRCSTATASAVSIAPALTSCRLPMVAKPGSHADAAAVPVCSLVYQILKTEFGFSRRKTCHCRPTAYLSRQGRRRGRHSAGPYCAASPPLLAYFSGSLDFKGISNAKH